MAEVDFGDSELFQQLDENVEPQPVHIRFNDAEDSELEPSGLQEQLARCEETIEHLRAENQELKRKLSVVSRPSGLLVEDKFDGPLVQILFMNHVISKQFHQEIEDFVSDLLQKYEEQQRANPEKTAFNIKPQPSSFLLEDNGGSNVDTIKKIKEAFSVVGSVLYFTNFCLDKLGQPLINENPQLTDGWEVPKYQQVFTQIVSLDGQEVQVKAKRPKACCFNCGSEEHQIKDCPKPRDSAHIGMKRKEFMNSCAESGNQNYQQRYHVEEERFVRFKPGVISSELQEALGITDKHLPPFIYRMRQLGYPPGWLKDAELENSGLSLYDGRDTSDGEIEEDPEAQSKSVSYDLSKLISFPGFNTPPLSGVADDWRNFGSIPMQPTHQKDIFASYLSHNFPKPSNTSQKRSSSHSGSERKRQKTSNSKGESPMDMETDSDVPSGFSFQPPLPPYCSPPPMPRGTPPSTPRNFIPPPPPTPTPPPLPKGTPPPTPNRGSPLLHSRASLRVQAQAADSMDEDTLTLEELEEQQRLIWAALEKAESTNSESDVNTTPLNGNSVASSPIRTETESVNGGKVKVQKSVTKSTPPDAFLEAAGHEPDDDKTQIPKGNNLLSEKDGDLSVAEDAAKPNGAAAGLKEMQEEDGDAAEEAACVPSPLKPAVPDRSKFAEGITPFEYDNMSEATGTYLKLRSVLKNSPRNQQKSKKNV
ncbi:PREDICTED: zinc finger CCHC domain-containing protein 8 [Nanorana parkeri]|uniref:zinc finger CCHC domain-containing protein 8 n=1 Tax=Nanorana parkeri TaxID=125878 RepID=UPI000854DE3C|nr:PREDICTED: zinc finger CCHC domain-containing protein 8 [Nanorana parkeri]